jgi:hypothetical protein
MMAGTLDLAPFQITTSPDTDEIEARRLEVSDPIGAVQLRFKQLREMIERTTLTPEWNKAVRAEVNATAELVPTAVEEHFAAYADDCQQWLDAQPNARGAKFRKGQWVSEFDPICAVQGSLRDLRNRLPIDEMLGPIVKVIDETPWETEFDPVSCWLTGLTNRTLLYRGVEISIVMHDDWSTNGQAMRTWCSAPGLKGEHCYERAFDVVRTVWGRRMDA